MSTDLAEGVEVLRRGAARAGFSVAATLVLPSSGSVRLDLLGDRDPGGRVHSARVWAPRTDGPRHSEFALLPTLGGRNLVERLTETAVSRAFVHAPSRDSRVAVVATSEYERLLALLEEPRARALRREVARRGVHAALRTGSEGWDPGSRSVARDVAALLSLAEVESVERFATAFALIDEVASGVPLEWALRRLTGARRNP